MLLKFALFITHVLAILSACGQPAATEIPTVIPTDTPVPTPTFTPAPTTPLAILVIPADMDQAASGLYQKTVYDLAQRSGFRFQVRNVLMPEDLTDPMLKIVIALPPDPGIATLASNTPQVQFLAVNIPDLTAGGNVSVLAPDGQADIPAFLAGYVAAMITDEYHIGMMIPQGNAEAHFLLRSLPHFLPYYLYLPAIH